MRQALEATEIYGKHWELQKYAANIGSYRDMRQALGATEICG